MNTAWRWSSPEEAERSHATACLLTLAALLLAVTLTASAEERKLTGDEIHKLLAGNSVHGMWGQSEYKSYFDPGGATTYHAKGRDASSGYWRTTATPILLDLERSRVLLRPVPGRRQDHLAGAGYRQSLSLHRW